MQTSAPPKGSLAVAPTDTGCCIRVTGRGTVSESTAAHDLATRTLEADPGAVVVFDLTACTYLDSTFLGLLTGLFQSYGRGTPHRFLVAAPPETRKKLMGPCRLDKMLPSVDAPPTTLGECVPLPDVVESTPVDLARHVMACHRSLASVESPMQAVFTRIADQLEKEVAAAETLAGTER